MVPLLENLTNVNYIDVLALSGHLMKTCTKCLQTFPASPEFFKNKGRGKLREKCRTCYSVWREQYRANNPEIVKKEDEYRVKNRLRFRCEAQNTTPEHYAIVRAFQDNKCALCRQQLPKRDCIDHDHTTGELRGILCYGCNIHFEREGSVASKIPIVKRYLSKPYIWAVAAAVGAKN